MPIPDKHQCYFHKNHTITKFCISKRCSLPLCDLCQQIHLQQHEVIQSKQKLGKPAITNYVQAHQYATQCLEQQLITIHKDHEYRIGLANRLKNTLSELGYNFIEQIKKSITNNEQINSNILKQTLNKLDKGSLKSLIFYYSGDIMEKYNQEENIIRKQNIQLLSELLNKIIMQIADIQKQYYQSIKINIQSNLQLIQENCKVKQNQKKYHTITENQFKKIKINQFNKKSYRRTQSHNLRKKSIKIDENNNNITFHNKSSISQQKQNKVERIRNKYERNSLCDLRQSKKSTNNNCLGQSIKNSSKKINLNFQYTQYYDTILGQRMQLKANQTSYRKNKHYQSVEEIKMQKQQYSPIAQENIIISKPKNVQKKYNYLGEKSMIQESNYTSNGNQVIGIENIDKKKQYNQNDK